MTTWLLAAAVAVALVALLAAAARWRRRRRAAFVHRLGELMRELGMVMGLQAATSAFEGVEGRSIVLTVDGKRLELDLVDALDIAAEPEFERRRQRLRWLVDQARIRQGV